MFIVLTYNLIFFYLLSRLVSPFKILGKITQNILIGIENAVNICRL